VTGGAGFIGSHTVDLLVGDGCRVLVIDDGSHPCGEPLPSGVELVEADCGSERAARALCQFRPEAVLHLAAKGGVERARRDPSDHARATVASSVALFHHAARSGARRVVTASSGGTVYGDRARLPAAERARPAPVSAYGAAKAAEELYLAAAAREHGLSALSLRYANVYGPRQDGTGEAGVVAITCTRLRDGAAPRVFGDGAQTRDFVYVGDVARANVAALAATRSGVVNIGTGRETAVGHVVALLRTISGSRVDVELAPRRASEVRRVCVDPRRAAAWLGWRPEVDLERGLELTFASFCSHEGGATEMVVTA